MNKHAVAFVSVFSLTLVLSVYYLMIPKGPNTDVVNNPISSPVVEVINARSYYFEALAKEREEGYEEKISELENQFINALDNETKAKILNEIKKLEKTYEEELKLERVLSDNGYPLSYVKVESSDIYVVVYEDKPSVTLASRIMKIIMNASEYTLPVEVEFKS